MNDPKTAIEMLAHHKALQEAMSAYEAALITAVDAGETTSRSNRYKFLEAAIRAYQQCDVWAVPVAPPPEGPWRVVHPMITSEEGEQYMGAAWCLEGPCNGRLWWPEDEESDALAVRDALNRVAAP